jgi:hypothetical protein
MKRLTDQYSDLAQRLSAQETEHQERSSSIETKLSNIENQQSTIEDRLQKFECSSQTLPSETLTPSGFTSTIMSEFPSIFDEFRKQQFSLLYRGTRDGFKGPEFHKRCDGHSSTLTIIQDISGNIFGGFTPLEWSSFGAKADSTLKSFRFTIRNPHNFPPHRFPLRRDRHSVSSYFWCLYGPCFGRDKTNCFCGDIYISDEYNSNSENWTRYFGDTYENNTGMDGKSFFTCESLWKVRL